MPAVMIRQLDAIERILNYTKDEAQRDVLRRQADMIWHSTCESVAEPGDRADVQRRYDAIVGRKESPERAKNSLRE